MKQDYDLIVLGGGPGGYPAAIRVAQGGKKVALIEATGVGGTCLNRGCIPSKALIASAEALKNIKKAREFGIHVENVSFDYPKMVERKEAIVTKVRKSLEGLIGSNKIELIQGWGKLVSANVIEVNGKTLSAENIILATGSEPRELPQFPFDGKKIHNSTTLLDCKTLPKKIIIVGAGVIGCEFASMYNIFGTEVILLEALDRIIPMECPAVSNALTKAFKKKGIQIRTQVVVEKIEHQKEGIKATLAGGETIEAEMALIAVGRVLNTSKIGLDKAGVKVNDKGLIPVNDRMETNVKGIYAIGDIASTWWLAHVASHQGIVAASNILGETMEMHYNAVPSVIFTDPEIGTVGYSLEKAIEEGYSATLGMFPFQALGKSQAKLQTEGFAQIVVDKKTGQVLGAQVVGHEAATLVAEMAVVIANEMTLDCITHTIHAHPTIAEAWMEAAMIAGETPLHMPPKARVPE
jgi:dihydrolipoamide dehydrogenase